MSDRFGGPKVSFDVRVVASCRDRHELESDRLVEVLSHHRIHLPSLKERSCDVGLLIDDFLANSRGAGALSSNACRALILHPWPLNIRALACVIKSAAVLAATPGEEEPSISLAHLPFEVVGKDIIKELIRGDASSEGEPLDPSVDEKSLSHGFMAAVEEVRQAALSPSPSAKESRPPSAFYDAKKLDRSYAKAIDPKDIIEALSLSHGNVSAAARRVGRPRAMVMKWIQEFDIDIADYRD